MESIESIKRQPLGIIDLANGPREIYPTDDFFINYLFNHPDHWGALKDMVNIFITKYRKTMSCTQLDIITDPIEVTTQYQYLSSKVKGEKRQDMRLQTNQRMVFVEVQNRLISAPPSR